MGRQHIATVAAIGRYPVKSMRAEALEEAAVTWNGLLGDRRWAFVRADTPSNFPWLTGRQHAPLILYTPHFERPPSIDEPEPPLWVTTPNGAVYAIDDPRLRVELEERGDHPLWLLNQNRGCFDSAHLSLIGARWTRLASGPTSTSIRWRPSRLMRRPGSAGRSRSATRPAWACTAVTSAAP